MTEIMRTLQNMSKERRKNKPMLVIFQGLDFESLSTVLYACIESTAIYSFS